MRKSYFRHLVKNNRIALVFFAILYGLIVFSTGISEDYESTLMTAYALSMILAFVLPVYLLRWVHSRKSADIYASLPISRKEMLAATLLFSFLVPTVCFLVFGGLVSLIGFSSAKISTYALLLAHTAFSTLCIILFNAACWLAANNSIDGIILLGSYTLMPVMIAVCLSSFLSSVSPVIFSRPGKLYLLSPLFASIHNADTIVHLNDPDYFNYGYDGISVWPLGIIMAVIAVIAALTLKKNFIDRKMERAEQLSDRFFAYPFVIGVYTAFILLMLCADIFSSSITLLIILAVFAVYMISQFVYRRQLKPTVKMILSFVVCLAVCLGVSAVTWYSECFHAADHIAASQRYLIYDYDSTLDEEGNVMCSFELVLDQNDEDQEEAASLMNDLQKKMTAAYYDRDNAGTETDLNSYQTLQIDTADTEEDYSKGNYRTVYSASASLSDVLDQEDLAKISRYTDVTIGTYDEDTGAYEEMSLTDYLKEEAEDD